MFVIPAGVITWPDLYRSHLILAKIIKYKPDAQIGYSVSTGFCETGLKQVEPVAPILNLVFENRTGSKLYDRDAITFDGLEKSSGHSVFLTLDNISNHVQNLPEAKILLGFLPKVQDTGIKTTKSFQSLQRDVYHKCFKIMLQPLLEKSEALYFGINGQVITFAAWMSFFLTDMFEADDITVTYKGTRCKMPCHICIVLQSDLNNMSLKLENVLHRTHENMKQVINDGQEKEYSVHSVENSFWKFL
ncbi:hypothetical protein C1646_782555 [Rhizophagus diaphanus]|nr:hypothetical protein C1646_782555 [Rhizophagus diaphanus] [Rhizophagus sp. MUCL 43196]